MSPLFRKSEQNVAQQAAVKAEIGRLKALGVEDLAVALLPAMGSDGVGKGYSVRPQQLCNDLLKDFPGAGQLDPLELMPRVRAGLEKLEQAGLVSSLSYQRSPVWRITSLGESALDEARTEQRVKQAG